MAADLGKRLLGEVEEVGLGEILHSIRIEHQTEVCPFNFPPLDRLLQAVSEARPSVKTTSAQPIVELMSLAAGDGKTHLLYHLCALAVLPEHLGGKQATAVVIDADGRFDVSRLAIHIQRLLRERSTSPTDVENGLNLDEETLSTLKHVHIFRPQSLESTSATLEALPLYLFDQHRHHSYDRDVAFIALDPAPTFYWQDRAETEDAAFRASTEIPAVTTNIQSGYIQLSNSLRAACKAFCCPAIMTTWHLGYTASSEHMPRSFRPQLLAVQPTLRLVVHKLPVRKFPPGISLEQAQRESASRQKAVEDSRFECFANEWELDERLLRTMRSKGSGFGFAITKGGTMVREDGNEGGDEYESI